MARGRHPHGNEAQSPGTETTRRGLLAGLAATGTAVGGLAAATGSAAAATSTYPHVSTRGHFDTGWFGVDLTDGNTELNYETKGSIPGVDTAAPDELLVEVHGWRNDESDAESGHYTMTESLGANGYDHPVVTYSWDSDTSYTEWWAATEIAERNGPKLANFLYQYRNANPDTTVRLVAHSLGARVVLRAVEVLNANGVTDAVESLSLLGGAADNDSVAVDGAYGSDVAAATGQTDNFWKEDDAVLDWAYSSAEFDSAVGEEGCEGTPPDNYEDHNVDYVPDHFSYDEKGEGCMSEVVAEF
jgi:pimeloyl-ACP methyl ester carboxylesterase